MVGIFYAEIEVIDLENPKAGVVGYGKKSLSREIIMAIESGISSGKSFEIHPSKDGVKVYEVKKKVVR